MTLQKNEQFVSAFYGELCCPSETLTLNDLDKTIKECKAMLDDAIWRTDKKEIAFWRKMLQKAKVQRRSILST